MADRRPDRLSLFVGLVSLLAAVLVLVDRGGLADVDPAAALAALLVAAGVLGLGSTTARLRSRR